MELPVRSKKVMKSSSGRDSWKRPTVATLDDRRDNVLGVLIKRKRENRMIYLPCPLSFI